MIYKCFNRLFLKIFPPLKRVQLLTMTSANLFMILWHFGGFGSSSHVVDAGGWHLLDRQNLITGKLRCPSSNSLSSVFPLNGEQDAPDLPPMGSTSATAFSRHAAPVGEAEQKSASSVFHYTCKTLRGADLSLCPRPCLVLREHQCYHSL